jgi:hypothetical protein
MKRSGLSSSRIWKGLHSPSAIVSGKGKKTVHRRGGDKGILKVLLDNNNSNMISIILYENEG